MATDASPEHLHDVFRLAALSVTNLYKSSINAQAKARGEGFQDCLDELLLFLNKEHLGLNDGEGWRIRAWANERLEYRDLSPHPDATDSDDDPEKHDAVSSPGARRPSSTASPPRVPEPEPQQRPYPPLIAQEPDAMASMALLGEKIVVDEPEVVVPSRDTFDFTSPLVYPQDAQSSLNLAGLHLSDSHRPHEHTTSHAPNTPTLRKTKRHGGKIGRPVRGLIHAPTHGGPRTASKRPMELNEFFDLTNIKAFGPPSKRRHL